jgi:hypothetical protein
VVPICWNDSLIDIVNFLADERQEGGGNRVEELEEVDMELGRGAGECRSNLISVSLAFLKHESYFIRKMQGITYQSQYPSRFVPRRDQLGDAVDWIVLPFD